MIKRIIAAAALAFTATSGAIAADVPKSTADCMEQVFDLATAAQDKNLSDAKTTEIEDLLTKMEDACTSEKFAEAANVSDDITAAIDK
ncbi:MAG: hypothetical protein APF80_04295 [Alphaproteobacteria bacterium BRH_c36]|nr:MAG: hypothetical protein APF80_04295 [Alphaproteobacteria bacterium BRH_c36]